MILITRPKHLAELTAAKLAKLHLRSIIVPFLDVEYLNVTFDNNKLDNYQALIITSQNAVSILQNQNLINKEILVYTIGSKSKAVLYSIGFKNVVSLGENVEALIRFFHKQSSYNEKMLYLRGEEISLDIKGNLEKVGYIVDEIIVYKSKPINRLSSNIVSIIESDVTSTLLYSSRTAQHFRTIALQHKTNLRNIRAVCISKKVSSQILDLKWHCVEVSNFPNEDQMLRLLTTSPRYKS